MFKINILALFLFFSYFSFSQNSLTGTITVVKAKVVTLKTEGEITFSKGDSCAISKDIAGTTNPFGIKISSGWLGVGTGLVQTVEKGKVTIKIIKETSEIIINGKKTEHFVPGKRMMLKSK